MIWLLAILAGFLGRMGGAGKTGAWYDRILDTKWRDIGVSLCIILAIILAKGFEISHIWVYTLIFALSWGALSTYWDKLFGFDNLWFSGFFMGITLYAGRFIGITPDFIIIRSVVLCIIWGALNKWTPKKVLCWRGDVANEFLRYFAVIITLIGV